MANKRCCFEGNHSYANEPEIKAKLKKEINKLINNFDVTEFYIEAESELDRIYLDCLEEVKTGHQNIKLCLVLTELTSKSKLDKSFLQKFDEIIQLNFEGISPQFVKLSKFDWLLENSDYWILLENSLEIEASPKVTVKDLSDKDLLFFAVRLKMLRLKSGLSQRELAKTVKVSPSTIGMYEQGRREPDFQTLLEICAHLKTTPDYILGLNKKIKPNLIEIDELLSEFIKEIISNNRVLCNGELTDRAMRKTFAISLVTALEVTKKSVSKKI